MLENQRLNALIRRRLRLLAPPFTDDDRPRWTVDSGARERANSVITCPCSLKQARVARHRREQGGLDPRVKTRDTQKRIRCPAGCYELDEVEREEDEAGDDEQKRR